MTFFGFSVAISGDYAIVGAYREDENAAGGATLAHAGSAYIFKRTGTTWAQASKIVASDRAAVDQFGGSVAISGDYAIVGANREDENAAGGATLTDAGSVYFFNNPAALPVELLSFSGKNREGGNLLTWQTASEVSNKGFQIERSPQPPKGAFQTWETIGFKTANNKASTYEFTDATPPLGVGGLYYRLRQMDNDGTETLSKVISIATKGKDKGLKVYPNPVSNTLTFENTDLSRDNREASNFQILNLLGQQVFTGKTPFGGKGLDVSALPQGTYMLRVGQEVAKFVKL